MNQSKHLKSDFHCFQFSMYNSIQMESPPLVVSAASVLKDLCFKNREELQAGFITAGWDCKKGPQVRWARQHTHCRVKGWQEQLQLTAWVLWSYWYLPSSCRCTWWPLAGCYSGNLLLLGVQAAPTSTATSMPNTEPTWAERNAYSLPQMVFLCYLFISHTTELEEFVKLKKKIIRDI